MSYASFECNCKYNLLEPRLLEYLDKKIHKIKTCIPLEQIYSITHGDLTIIKDYLNRNKVETCSGDFILKPHDDSNIVSSDDFMSNMIKRDLREDYHVYPPEIKYNYPLHHYHTNELNCEAEDEKEVSIDNFRDVHKYHMKVEREKNEFIKPFKYPLNKSYKHTQDSKRKTYGYDNPVEHYFYYLNKDIQTPNHVILPFPRGGFDTRRLNHK